MAIWVMDTETGKFVNGKFEPKLDASGKNFLLGVILKDGGSVEYFKNPKKMWEHILDGAEKEARRGKKLTIYGHNMKYDFFQVANLKDKRLRYLSENPFICSYFKPREVEMQDNDFRKYEVYLLKNKLNYKILERVLDTILIDVDRECIKFLDSMSIFRMSLKKLGEIINVEKLEMKANCMEDLKKYCLRDCEIVMQGIKLIKYKLTKESVRIKSMCTISQIAISYVLNELRKKEDSENMFYTNKKGEVTEWVHKTRYPEDVHNAYRGGYVRAWKTGYFKGCNAIDVNSLYPYSAMNIDFPDLRTERKIFKPLKVYSEGDLFGKIGVSKVMIKNCEDKLGLLMIRTPTKGYIPLKGKYIIGVWTNYEIKKAIENGYEIINVEWSILWDKSEWKGFSEVYKKLYSLRMVSEDKFDYNFYKDIMNRSIGKFGQNLKRRELFIDDVEEIRRYLNDKYKIIRGLSDDSYNLIISKEDKEVDRKKYYTPILPALVTAYARCRMYDEYKKLPIDKLLYSDTDSIIWKGDKRDLKLFNISKDIGDFKIEEDFENKEELINKDCLIWGTKSKSIGNNIAVAGAFKSDLTLEDFKQGKVKTKKMIGLRQGNLDIVGNFTEEQRDLNQQRDNFEKERMEMDKQLIYIDDKIEDLKFFKENINKIIDMESDVLHDLIEIKKEGNI